MTLDLRAILMGVSFSLMWSSAFATARIIVADAPPLHALALRFAISGAIAVGLARLLGQTWHLTPQQWRATAVFGLCQNGIYLGLNFVAMQSIDASLASIIASTMPLLVAALGWMAFSDKIRPMGIVGLLAGAVGVCIIMGARLTVGVDLAGVALCGIGALALAVATLTLRGAMSGGNLLMVVGLQMLVGSVLLGSAAQFESGHVRLTAPLIAAFIYQMLVPGLIATMIWFSLVDRIGAVRAASFHFLNPFFGVATAALLLGEAIRPLDVVGVGVIMAGILAVQLSKARG